MLQCVAVRCSVLQCVAVRRSALLFPHSYVSHHGTFCDAAITHNFCQHSFRIMRSSAYVCVREIEREIERERGKEKNKMRGKRAQERETETGGRMRENKRER